MSHGLFSLWCSSSGSRSEAIVVMSFSLVSCLNTRVSGVFCGRVFWISTHFEHFEVDVKEWLVDGAKVLLDTGLAEALCDAADESRVLGKSLGNVSKDFLGAKLKGHVHPHRYRRPLLPQSPR
jgi:hypothetical protein